MSLPTFKYHPDPIATGSVVPSKDECVCCEKARGYIYTGPVYAEEELGDSLCPWCISDGSAHAEFGASFTDENGVGGYGEWEDVAETALAEVAYRTPGFSGWQQERWWTHCGDAAAFIGRAGHSELLAAGPEAIEAIRLSTALADGPQWRAFLSVLDKDGSPSAYLFRCRSCSALGGYQDCD